MSEWTVKRPHQEQSPGARIGSYLFGVVLLGAVGGLGGAFLPLFMGGGVRKKDDTYYERRRREERREAAHEMLVHDTKASMTGRGLFGALLGAVAGGLLAFKTEAARKKKLAA